MKLETVLTIAFASVSLVAASAVPAAADDTGLGTALHTTVRVGGKLCFADHSHSGTGSGASRKVAEMQAINNWAGFTAWEYGTDWGKFGKAIKKSMSCSGSGASYNCNVEATPCK